MQVTVVDYGMGNLGSISNMLQHLGHTALVTSQPADILLAEKIILPGVGHFDRGMQHLIDSGLVDALTQRVVAEKKPVLGICLGLQLMTRSSEEGKLKGLGWIDADVIRFDTSRVEESIRIPHMGWNTVTPASKNALVADAEERFYFVHAYHLHNVPSQQILCTTHYGYDFVSGVVKENIYGVQFHPEKSHRFGMSLLKNFIEQVH